MEKLNTTLSEYNQKMEEAMDTVKLDKALEDALQMPARTETEQFQRAVSVANVKFWYERSAGNDVAACRIWDKSFMEEHRCNTSK